MITRFIFFTVASLFPSLSAVSLAVYMSDLQVSVYMSDLQVKSSALSDHDIRCLPLLSLAFRYSTNAYACPSVPT